MQTLLAAAQFGQNDRGIILFGFEIYYYALFMVAGMIVAACLSALLMKRRNMSPDFIFTLFVFCIPSAIIGARLFSCLTDPDIGIKAFFRFREGGMSITGGVLFGVGAGLIVCLVTKVNFFRAADCVVVTILLAQAIGRWGNYFNEEVYGGVVTNPALQWFPLAVQIGNTWHYAFFFIEGCINVVGFAILFSAAWYRKAKPNGLLACLYFVWYGAVRSIMEPLRDPEYILDNGGVMWSQIFAVALCGLGICGCLLLMILNFKKEGKFIGSRTGDPCGIREYLSSDKNETPYFSKINMFGMNYPPKPSKEELTEEQKAEKSNLPQVLLLILATVGPILSFVGILLKWFIGGGKFISIDFGLFASELTTINDKTPIASVQAFALIVLILAVIIFVLCALQMFGVLRIKLAIRSVIFALTILCAFITLFLAGSYASELEFTMGAGVYLVFCGGVVASIPLLFIQEFVRKNSIPKGAQE